MSNLVAIGKHGRRFFWTGLVPVQKADGHGTYIAQWQGTCATCGGPFDVQTPVSAFADGKASSAFDLANCPAHRRRCKGKTERQGGEHGAKS